MERRDAELALVEVLIHQATESHKIIMCEEESLMDALLREGYMTSAICGGMGRCGKCKVRVLEGQAEITSEDAHIFPSKELEEGWRLACRLYPQENMEIALSEDAQASFAVMSGYDEAALAQNTSVKKDKEEKPTAFVRYRMAIDLGTTTLVFQLLDADSGAVVQTVSSVNSQRKYGADVISRMQASVDGHQEELRACIQQDLQAGIKALLETCGIGLEQVERIAIAGNTTMGHLLLGYDCKGLGTYPFTPVNIGFLQGSIQEIIGMAGACPVVLLPGISTYVGGDIVAGIVACGMNDAEHISLLVDLGTNGEMALGNRDKLLVASTAAGPAFEGGNITWGMGSVAGAICSVQIRDGKVQVRTIGDQTPVGICGTGVIEAVAEMLQAGSIDEQGLLEEQYFEDGFPLGLNAEQKQIVITQKDIRELQLAKAAIRAGIETLLLRYGITMEQVDKVYLAGGFGYYLDAKKAIDIGMLPEECAETIIPVGNSSLAGAVQYVREARSGETMEALSRSAEEISLALDKDFNELYLQYMSFEKNM